MISKRDAITLATSAVQLAELDPNQCRCARFLEADEFGGPRWCVQFEFLDEEIRGVIPLLVNVDALVGAVEIIPSL